MVKWGSLGLRLAGCFWAVHTTSSPAFTSNPPDVARTNAHCHSALSAYDQKTRTTEMCVENVDFCVA
jgi:hypothetical protein